MISFMRIGMILILGCLTACGPRSLEDFREEGEGVTRSLVKELSVIRTRSELLKAVPRLQKLFNNLIDVMIAAREFQEKSSKFDPIEWTYHNHELSDQLRIELNRVYALEGTREIIEKCQEQALHRLDAFEKRLAKHKRN